MIDTINYKKKKSSTHGDRKVYILIQDNDC